MLTQLGRTITRENRAIRRWSRVTVALALFGCLTGVAEPRFNDPVITGGGSPQGNADSIAAGITSKNDASKINFTDQEGQDNDRRRQYEAAQKRANTGKNVAIATGAALTATAIPMLASPIASVRATGAALMAKAALEFAQAAANKKVADKNGASANKLKETANQDGRQATVPDNTAKEIQNKINSPELNKILTDKGVNPEEFTQRLANGEMGTAADVLSAAGETDMSAEDLAKGEMMAEHETASVVGDMKRLGYDESLPTQAAPVTAGNSFGATLSKAPEDHGTGSRGVSDALSKAGIAPDVVANSFAANQTSPGGKLEDFIKGEGGEGSLAEMLANLHGITSEEAVRLPVSMAMEALGISKTLPRQNIFQLAHRNYRGFGKWRKKKKQTPKNDVVAMQDTP